MIIAAAPQRTCFGCGLKADKCRLIRLALDREGRAAIDPDQVAGGRGLYICPRPECFAKAAQRNLPFAARRRLGRKTLAAFLKEPAGAVQLTQKGVA